MLNRADWLESTGRRLFFQACRITTKQPFCLRLSRYSDASLTTFRARYVCPTGRFEKLHRLLGECFFSMIWVGSTPQVVGSFVNNLKPSESAKFSRRLERIGARLQMMANDSCCPPGFKPRRHRMIRLTDASPGKTSQTGLPASRLPKYPYPDISAHPSASRVGQAQLAHIVRVRLPVSRETRPEARQLSGRPTDLPKGVMAEANGFRRSAHEWFSLACEQYWRS